RHPERFSSSRHYARTHGNPGRVPKPSREGLRWAKPSYVHAPLVAHYNSLCSMTADPTAAILLIGNEILSGKVEDENARFLTRELRALGVALRRMEVVPDAVGEIADSVRILAARFDHVFTSGGVG